MLAFASNTEVESIQISGLSKTEMEGKSARSGTLVFPFCA